MNNIDIMIRMTINALDEIEKLAHQDAINFSLPGPERSRANKIAHTCRKAIASFEDVLAEK